MLVEIRPRDFISGSSKFKSTTGMDIVCSYEDIIIPEM